MPTQAVSQMNIRMDTQLKDAGDKVLAERNTTPTQLVRAAAKRANANLLVTWDKVMLSKAVVPTLTPADAIDKMSTWM